jgi:hypothetical protein
MIKEGKTGRGEKLTDEEESKEEKSDRFRAQACTALKMEAVRSFETSISTYQCTRHHITSHIYSAVRTRNLAMRW